MPSGKVYIVASSRTPVGSFMGELASLTAVELAVPLVTDITKEVPKTDVDQCYVGNVLSAGLGQNIADQIVRKAGCVCPAATINRVCGSGMMAIIEAYKSIKLGKAKLVVAGGTESMSNAPHTIALRAGKKFGDAAASDSLEHDGLTDASSGKSMGVLTEQTITEYGITREQLDEYARSSYTKARNAVADGCFDSEILPITIQTRKTTIEVSEDSEINNVADLGALSRLRPAFGGELTAGNSSKISDGACMLLLASEDYVRNTGIKPLAEILDYNMHADAPERFSVAPIASIRNMCIDNHIEIDDIDALEVNEAFAHVPICVNRELGIPYEKINIFGGAVAIGHPLGCSGARIVATLITVLDKHNKQLGCASLCNGGGGATSMLIKKV
jgi:acetyl-CoA C-acetyltransferase